MNKNKMVIMLDADDSHYDKTKDTIPRMGIKIKDITKEKSADEADLVAEEIDKFVKFDASSIMLLRFSGSEYIAQVVGDTSSELVIPLSYDKQSLYYCESLETIILELISKLKNYIKRRL